MNEDPITPDTDEHLLSEWKQEVANDDEANPEPFCEHLANVVWNPAKQKWQCGNCGYMFLKPLKRKDEK
jgi:ribosomal protein S27AE